MSIHIKGVELPAEGVLCIDIFPDGRVASHCDCTIKQAKAVPVPVHGRLIDADAVAKMVFGSVNQEDAQGYMFTNIICQILKDAPTIIPAEEAEK